MRHDEIRRLLPQLAEGELEAAEERRVRRHLEECEACAGWLETLAVLAEGLAETAGEAAHPSSDQLARRAVGGALLAPTELEALDEHLDSCDECGRLLELSRGALAGGRRAPRSRRARSWRRWISPAGLPMPARLALAAALILAVALGLMSRRSPEVVAATDHEIADSVLRGRQVIEADGSITARGVTVASGGEVTFRARQAVQLENGFSVSSGASLTVVAGGSTVRSERPERAANVG